jgi:hypothetical protein
MRMVLQASSSSQQTNTAITMKIKRLIPDLHDLSLRLFWGNVVLISMQPHCQYRAAPIA